MNRARVMLGWARDIFGDIALDRHERAARFLEEAVELIQCEGLARDTAERILARVYGREKGSLNKEIGQAMATLEMLAENIGISADAECEREFTRVRGIPKDEWQRRHLAKIKIGIAG